MFPSETIADGWNNALPQLIAFVGMATPVFEALEREFGEFGGRITNLAGIPEKVFREGVTGAKVIVQAFREATEVEPEVPEKTRPFFPVETGQAGLLWRIAQRIYWKSTGKAWKDFPDFDVMVEDSERTAAFGAGTALPSVSSVMVASTPLQQLKYKMNQVVDQADDSEFTPPTVDETNTWEQNYFTQEQNSPPEDEDATEIQTKGLSIRINAKRTPYAGFGVWGPCGKKVLRAMKFRTWTPTGNPGEYSQKEPPGPPNFTIYMTIWVVLVVALKKLQAVAGHALKTY